MLYIFLVAFLLFILYTRKDWTLTPRSSLQCYFLFTVVCFSYRWLFQVSPTETTIFDSDAPLWVRSIKDFVFVLFIGTCLVKNKVVLSRAAWYVLPFVAWFSFCSVVKLLTGYDSYRVFFFWRIPMEYVPLVFLTFEEDFEYFTKFVTGCLWIVIGFLGLEVLADRPTGFGKGGLLTRFGSVFGSPNDLGMFAVLALLGVLAFPAYIPKRSRVVLVPGLVITLMLTVSRGAWVALIAGLIAMWPVSKKWLFVAVTIAAVSFAVIMTSVQQSKLAEDIIARAADESAMDRLQQYQEVKKEVSDWEAAGALFGSWPHIDQENFYCSVLLRSGVPGLVLYLALVAVTLSRARHVFLRGCLVAFAVASCFSPYPDYFPSCAYFWLLIGVTWATDGWVTRSVRVPGAGFRLYAASITRPVAP